jgi:hypothetical protein
MRNIFAWRPALGGHLSARKDARIEGGRYFTLAQEWMIAE